MNKKNQSNNPVGDDSNLSHETQPPSIWDNISQELNALDGNTVAMDEGTIDSSELSDVADFSVIKEGFQANFSSKKPPKFTWDKIEQDLESFTISDAPADFSAIKTGFEQNYKEASVPNFTWDDLAEEMDNPKPKEKVEDYSLVKHGFEKQYSAVVVPLFSWADLAQRMDNEAILADVPDHYSIIKDSFQKEYLGHQPAANTWAALDQALQSPSHWKKAWVLLSAPSFLKKAALFIIIGVFMLGNKFYWADNTTISSSTIANNQTDENEVLFDRIKKSTITNKGSRSHQEEKPEENYGVTSREKIHAALVAPVNDPSEQGTSIPNNASKENKIIKGASNSSELVNPLNQSVDYTNITPLLIEENKFLNNKTNTHDLIVIDNVVDNNEAAYIRNQIALNQDDVLRSNLKLLANVTNPSWIGQDMLDIELLDNGVSVLIQKFILDEAIPKMEEDNFTLVRQAQKGKKIRFEVGLVGKGGTSMLLGPSSNDAQNSTPPTHFCPTGALGVLANYHFSLNDAVVLGVYPYSTIKKHFGNYNSNGRYEEMEINLSLVDLTIGYQRTLIRYNSLSQVPSKIYARLDLGLGILTNTQTMINQQVINPEDLYNKFNFSAGLALGNSHEINQFVIDYGLTGSIGLNNLVRTSNTTILEPARLLNIGAYIGLRYIIFPRLEPSKKQRQFDWSPPFYIEEPAF